jgi:hypothetical protein
MRSLIAILAIYLLLSSCKVEAPEFEKTVLRAHFRVSYAVTECPGSWVIQRTETGDKFFTANLPQRLRREGNIFHAETLYTMPPGDLSPCLSQFNLREIRILALYE